MLITALLLAAELVYFRIADKCNIIDKPNQRSSASITSGSFGVAYILLFLIGSLILATGDVTYLILLLVYGVDGCLTICHRILLHENLGEAHRKHAYQLMANELHIGHVKVSSFYMILQLAISLGFIYLCPVLASSCGLSLVTWHWIYLASALVILAVAYILFKKKYYHLHEEYLASLK